MKRLLRFLKTKRDRTLSLVDPASGRELRMSPEELKMFYTRVVSEMQGELKALRRQNQDLLDRMSGSRTVDSFLLPEIELTQSEMDALDVLRDRGFKGRSGAAKLVQDSLDMSRSSVYRLFKQLEKKSAIKWAGDQLMIFDEQTQPTVLRNLETSQDTIENE